MPVSTIGGHIPANRWQMASTRMGKHASSMDSNCLFLHGRTQTWTTRDYCSVSQVWLTWGRLERARLRLLWFPSRGTHHFYYLLLINSSHACHFSVLHNGNNLSPELEVLHNQTIVRVLFPEQLAKRTTKIRFTPFTGTISCTASFIFACPQSSHGLTCEQQHPSWKCQVLWYSQCLLFILYLTPQSELCINRCLRWARAKMRFCMWGWQNAAPSSDSTPAFYFTNWSMTFWSHLGRLRCKSQNNWQELKSGLNSCQGKTQARSHVVGDQSKPSHINRVIRSQMQ